MFSLCLRCWVVVLWFVCIFHVAMVHCFRRLFVYFVLLCGCVVLMSVVFDYAGFVF